jgi:hypothetical protein
LVSIQAQPARIVTHAARAERKDPGRALEPATEVIMPGIVWFVVFSSLSTTYGRHPSIRGTSLRP